MKELKLFKGDRLICTLHEGYHCLLMRNGKESQLENLKIVSLPDSKAVYIDTESVVSGKPKVVFNIGSDQVCKLVKWRKSGLNLLSCFRQK